MPSNRDTVATSTQFTAVDNAGLWDFASYNGDNVPANRLPKITTLGYYTTGAGTGLTVILKGAAATERITIKDEALTDWSLTAAEIVVPRDSNGDCYELQVTTTGKDADGTFSVCWEAAET